MILKKLKLSEPTEVESLHVNPLPPRENSSRNKRERAFEYESILITTPMDDEAIRNNSGSVTITASIEPQLRYGHMIVLYLDGKEHMSSQAPHIHFVRIKPRYAYSPHFCQRCKVVKY